MISHTRIMSRLLLMGSLCMATVSQSALAGDIRIEAIPDSAAGFVALRNELATTPEGGAAMLIVALLGYENNQALGEQFMTIALDQSNVMPGDAYKGFAPSRSIASHVRRLRENGSLHYTGKAYVRGATAENNYATNPPYTIVTSRNPYSGKESDGRVKVFVDVHGARPRPVTLRRNDKGIWKAIECSSVFLSVPQPAAATPTDEL